MPKKKEKNKSRSRGKTLKLSWLQPPTFAQTIRRLTNATHNTWVNIDIGFQLIKTYLILLVEGIKGVILYAQGIRNNFQNINW
jgi:hypothetical protein